MNVESAYHYYLKLTGEAGAAASLVLAEAMTGAKPTAPDEKLSVKQAAEELGISPKTVYELCKKGQIKHNKVGRLIRIRRSDLDDMEPPSQPSVARHW